MIHAGMSDTVMVEQEYEQNYRYTAIHTVSRRESSTIGRVVILPKVATTACEQRAVGVSAFRLAACSACVAPC